MRSRPSSAKASPRERRVIVVCNVMRDIHFVLTFPHNILACAGLIGAGYLAPAVWSGGPMVTLLTSWFSSPLALTLTLLPPSDNLTPMSTSESDIFGPTVARRLRGEI